jgi:hypothetical protein
VPWSGAPNCPVCHRTVSGAPGPCNSELFTFGFLRRCSAIIYRTVRCATGLFGAPAKQRLPAQRSTATDTCKRYSARTFRAEVRAAARGASDSEQYLSGATRRQSSNGRTLTVGWRGWRTIQHPVAQRTVRCAHRQQPPPSVVLVGEGYKYPSTTSTPTIQAFITLHSIQEQSATLQDTNQSHRSDRSLQFNSSALGLVRGSIVFLCCSSLLGLAFFSFSLLTLKCFVSEARDTNCVVVLVGSKWPMRLRKKPHSV